MFPLIRRSSIFARNFLHLKSLSCLNYSNSTNNDHNNEWETSTRTKYLVFGTFGLGIAYGLYKNFGGARITTNTIFNETVVCASNRIEVGTFREGLPKYTAEEVAKHAIEKDRIWVMFKEGVYDITDFVSKHPGGDNILLGAGTSIEPFWMIYGIHHNDKVYAMLEEMRIGNVDIKETEELIKNMDDPYSTDPKRHPVLIPRSVKPYNAEPIPSLLIESYYTPNEVFYVRNHLPVPIVDINDYELEVEVEGCKKGLSLKLEDLKKFPKVTIPATVMCAGNRRSDMTKVKPVKGLDWGFAAIGNAEWTGVRLRDVLFKAGACEGNPKFKHVWFEGLDLDPTSKPYSASIPFQKAIDKYGDVILAYEMNGQPLSRDHGYPLRVIVPGVAGARNVKWLGRIYVSSEENKGFWQQNDYKGFSPSTDWDTVDFTKSPAIQGLPVISAICVPQHEETVEVVDGFITVKGYGWSGSGQKIIRVDLTVDGGKTWHVADIDKQDNREAPSHWSWTFWSAKIPVPSNVNQVEIWAKAVDSSYNVQPESFNNIWNLRGVLSNAYHRVPINLKHKK